MELGRVRSLVIYLTFFLKYAYTILVAPTNRQLLILLILVISILGFGFLISHVVSTAKGLSFALLNIAGIETSASFNTAPARIAGLDYDIKNQEVILSWMPIMKSRLNGYRIYRGDSPDNRSIIGGSNQANFTDKDIERGKVYYYGVTAVNDLGEGRMSAPLKVKIK